MKRYLILFIVLLFNISFAYEPGITKYVVGSKALSCKEISFVSGIPVELEGTLEYKESGKGEDITRTYNYKLDNDAGDSLTRQLTFSVSSTEKLNKQKILQWELTKYSESLIIGGKTYTLKSYNISRNQIEDVKPVGSYFAGNISLEKEYEQAEEIVKIAGSGSVYGYDTVWAKNETVNMSYTISSITDGESDWTGKYNTTVSDTDQKRIKYVENKPTEISFDGSYIVIENNISTIRYESEMPEFYNGIATDYIEESNDSYKYESFPVETRLANYNILGIKGHWGEEEIRKAFSLEIMDEWKEKATPDTAVTRGEFAKIIAKVIKIEATNDGETTANVEQTATNNEEATTATTTTYRDVPTTNEYYNYIKLLSDAGVVQGVGNSRFMPNAIVTRAEAVTMIIKAIGFENKAPEPIPNLNYNDSDEVPSWATKYIYMADKIGIIKGNEMQEVMPSKQLTKAEIAAICNRLISYLTEELSEEYLK